MRRKTYPNVNELDPLTRYGSCAPPAPVLLRAFQIPGWVNEMRPTRMTLNRGLRYQRVNLDTGLIVCSSVTVSVETEPISTFFSLLSVEDILAAFQWSSPRGKKTQGVKQDPKDKTSLLTPKPSGPRPPLCIFLTPISIPISMMITTIRMVGLNPDPWFASHTHHISQCNVTLLRTHNMEVEEARTLARKKSDTSSN